MGRIGSIPKILETGRNEFELVEFWIKEKLENGSIYTHLFGLNVAKVREVIWLPEIIRVPNLPRGIEGVINVRGEVLPVIDLPKAMGINEPLPEELNTRKAVIIAQFYGIEVGLIVHEAKRIRRFTWDKIKSVPSAFSMKFGSKVVGVIEVEEGKFLLLLDVESLFIEMGLVSIREEIGTEMEEEIIGPVMVVEDSFAVRKITADILEKAGFKDIILCEDGLEAWRTLEAIYKECVEKKIDILDKVSAIITDVEMPNMDGYTLTKKIKDHPAIKRIPVIVNTSLSGEFSALRARTVNADAFIVKFHPDELVMLVKRLIKKARSQKVSKDDEGGREQEGEEVSHEERGIYQGLEEEMLKVVEESNVKENKEEVEKEVYEMEFKDEMSKGEKNTSFGSCASEKAEDVVSSGGSQDFVDDILNEILKEVESGRMGSKDDTIPPIYEVPTESVLKRSSSDLLELLSRLKAMISETDTEDLSKRTLLESIVGEIEKEIRRREKKEEGKVIEKLYRVTRESEEHGTKLMKKLEDLMDLVMECKNLLEEVRTDQEKMGILSAKLALMSEIIIETMSEMQYQDVLRQKIERVIVALKRLNDYLNDWFGTDFIGE
ncbi:MAG: chemotaxis protein [Thermosulfidibacteraceae bacterium]|jgi:two-component system chemotaxis response regulator CheV